MVSEQNWKNKAVDFRLDPEKRLCAKFDAVSIAKFRAPIEEMGLRVLDNCAEEHMM